LSEILGKYLFNQEIYKWNDFIGKPMKPITTTVTLADFIYFPACISRFLGSPIDNSVPYLAEVMLEISYISGISISIPSGNNKYCCGTLFSSKGFVDAACIAANDLIDYLWCISKGGAKTIIIDSTSCYQNVFTFRDKLSDENKLKYDSLTFLDTVLFIEKYILDNLKIHKKLDSVVLHHTCSSVKLNTSDSLLRIAEACANNATVPLNSGCCGMAGDRGLLIPELTKLATKAESSEIMEINADGYYSSNIPCETGMSNSTGKQYLSIAYLIRDVIKLNE
jgi:D-lactate dehydrogenase